MNTKDFTLTLIGSKSAEDVYKTIANVRSWWSGYFNEVITGSAENPGDEFSFRAGDGVHYTKHKLIEVIPNKKLVWLVTESNLSFANPTDEWTGTKMIFEISGKDGKTEIVFTHQGLNPEFQCYDACAPAWTKYLQKLENNLNNNN